MPFGPSTGDLEFVRRAAKEIVSRLMPDDLPFFDVVWQAFGPVLNDLLRQPVCNAAEVVSIVEHLRGQGLAAKWSPDADLTEASTMVVLGRTLAEARERGPCSEDRIGEIAARQSLHSLLPGPFIRMVHRFVADFCGGVSEPEAASLLPDERTPPERSICYYVFCGGSDQFFPDQLPAELLQLRDRVLFWIHRAEGDYRSRGQIRERGLWLKPQTEQVLRFLCNERNAGRTIALSDLYKSVWQKQPTGNVEKMLNAVRVEVSGLNQFSEERFEGETGNVLVRYIREARAYGISTKAVEECCIVRPVSLPK
jgi:hypothetical protein